MTADNRLGTVGINEWRRRERLFFCITESSAVCVLYT